MAYGYFTPKYKIPVIVYGQTISPSEERKAALIIENQLKGLIESHSGGNGVYSQGTAIGTFSSGNSSVTMSAPGVTPTIQAFINQVFIKTFDDLVWTGLPDLSTIFLYIRLVETDTTSSRLRGDVTTEWNTSGVIPSDGILVATATTTAVDITVDGNPSGRVSISTVAEHEAQDTNPHGTTLHQDNILTSGLTVLGDVNVNGETIINGIMAVLQEVLFRNGVQVFGETTFEEFFSVSGLSTFFGSALFHGEAVFKESAIYEKMTVLSGLENWGRTRLFGDIIMDDGKLVDGRDLSVDAATLAAHVLDIINNPHNVTIEQISGISRFGGTEVLGDIPVASGVTIDGVDVSELSKMLEGGNADPAFLGATLSKSGHTHNMSGLPFDSFGWGPVYPGSVFSGIGTGIMKSIRREDGFGNVYRWTPTITGEQLMAIVQEIGIRENFMIPSGLTIRYDTHGVGGSFGSLKSVTMLDTAGAAVSLVNNVNLQTASYDDQDIGFVSPASNTWEKGRFATLIYTMGAASGSIVDLGYGNLRYQTVFPQ